MSKVFVVTGSTRGIGHGIAQNLLKRGAQVVVSGRSQEAVDKVVAELGGAPNVAGKACEVSSYADQQALWDFAVATFGKVDSWVNNAGIGLPRKPLAESDPADFEKIVRINLLGAMNGTHVALKGMKEQGFGDIWNMEGFGSGGQKADGLAPYGSTKRALTYFTNSVAKELDGGPVSIHHLSPGIVVTDLLVGDYADDPEGFEKAKRIFNILGDKVETVTPMLADGLLKGTKNGGRVAWLSGPKAAGRFATAAFKKRDLFEGVEVPTSSQ